MNAANVNLQQCLYEVSCFLSHQSAEKALKAVYIEKFEMLWKIHDLIKLGRKLDAPIEILEICDLLNPHYIAARYPVDVSYTEEMAVESFEKAGKVLQWSKEKLRKE